MFQKDFFDQKPSKTPWPDLLRRHGFDYLIKPRENKNWQVIRSLEMKKGDQVLDVGCGTGHFLARIKSSLGIKGVGIDFSTESIKQAKRWQKRDLSYLVANAEKLPFKNESFDYVLSFDVLEHIKDQKKVLIEMARVLKKGGKLLLYTINKRQQGTWNWLLEKVGIPTDQLVAHDKKLFFLSENLEKQLKKLGIEKKELIYYDSFFSLLLNELITLTGMLIKKLALDKKRIIGKTLLILMTIISKTLGPICDWLDWPWKKLGLSNGFYFMSKEK
ncbi:class I SAM-dependent methyltransferase [Patescibacteria group bacterium]